MLRESFLPKLRCPDCLEGTLSCDSEVRSSSGRQGKLICRGCGRTLALRRGILHALPSQLSEAMEANRQYYDELSAQECNLLEKRAATRNHRNKTVIVLEALGLSPSQSPRTVLEFGMGVGAHGATIQQSGHEYVGLDISPGLLEQAVERLPALRESCLVVADAIRTPFQDGLFDGVFCVATLHHLPRPEEGVREAVRVLAPGGRFCFLEPKRFYPTQLVQFLRHPKTEVSALQTTPANLTRWLKAAEITNLQVTYGIFTPNGPSWMRGVWDAMDRVCQRLKGLHVLSVMFCVQGSKE